MKRLDPILCLSAALALAGTTPGLAQNPWISLADVGHPASLDTTAIMRRSPDLAVVRVRLVGYRAAGYVRLETQEVNCRTKESRVLQAEDRPINENTLGALPAPPPDPQWHSYAPNSLGARLLAAVCAYLGRGGSRP